MKVERTCYTGDGLNHQRVYPDKSEIEELKSQLAASREEVEREKANAKLMHDALNQYDKEFAKYRHDKNKELAQANEQLKTQEEVVNRLTNDTVLLRARLKAVEDAAREVLSQIDDEKHTSDPCVIKYYESTKRLRAALFPESPKGITVNETNEPCTRLDIPDCHARVGTGGICMNGFRCPPVEPLHVTAVSPVFSGSDYGAESMAALAKMTEALKPERPKIVCLCGSTRFGWAFDRYNLKETLAGNIILSIGCNTHNDEQLFYNMTEKEKIVLKNNLDELHKRKIDLADEIFVLNCGKYIGESTRSEIDYAVKHGKLVRYLEPTASTGDTKEEAE
jgi:hypothetical protein